MVILVHVSYRFLFSLLNAIWDKLVVITLVVEDFNLEDESDDLENDFDDENDLEDDYNDLQDDMEKDFEDGNAPKCILKKGCTEICQK